MECYYGFLHLHRASYQISRRPPTKPFPNSSDTEKDITSAPASSSARNTDLAITCRKTIFIAPSLPRKVTFLHSDPLTQIWYSSITTRALHLLTDYRGSLKERTSLSSHHYINISSLPRFLFDHRASLSWQTQVPELHHPNIGSSVIISLVQA